MTHIDKDQLRSALRERIEARLRALTESQQATQQGATHEEARPEHAKDTRSIEASYLARGLAERVAALKADLALLGGLELRCFEVGDAIALCALVGLEHEDGTRASVWLAPAGAGEEIEVDGVKIRVVTPASPLGRSLLGRRVDDELEIALPSGPQEVAICWIA